MRLSRRIHEIAARVRPGESAADIGTDHGYVPMILMQNNISPYVIMSDISEASLDKARETFRLQGIRLPDECFRCGDGISTITLGEADNVIIAGLGGLTIIKILSDDPDKSRSFPRLILQPRKHSGNLRYYLYNNGWDIESETLAAEGKFSCEIITAVPSVHGSRECPYPEHDIRWKYPETLLDCDRGLVLMRTGWKISSIREQLESLRSSRSDQGELAASLRKDLDYLEKLHARCSR